MNPPYLLRGRRFCVTVSSRKCWSFLMKERSLSIARAAFFLRIVRLVFFSESRKRAIFSVFALIFREMSADFGIGSWNFIKMAETGEAFIAMVRFLKERMVRRSARF